MTYSLRHRGRTYQVDDRLTRKQATAILEDRHPEVLTYQLKGGEPCPVEPGDRLAIIADQLWLEVVSFEGRAGWWRVRYRVTDFRPVYLGRASGGTRDAGQRIGTGNLSGGSLRLEDDYDGGGWQDMDRARRRLRSIEATEAERAREAAHLRSRSVRAQLTRTLVSLPPEAQAQLLAEIARRCEAALDEAQGPDLRVAA